MAVSCPTVEAPQAPHHHCIRPHHRHIPTQLPRQAWRRTYHTGKTRTRTSHFSTLPFETAEALLLKVLARASLCKEHARPYATSRPRPLDTPWPTQRENGGKGGKSGGRLSTQQTRKNTHIVLPKEDLKGLVEFYASETDHLWGDEPADEQHESLEHDDNDNEEELCQEDDDRAPLPPIRKVIVGSRPMPLNPGPWRDTIEELQRCIGDPKATHAAAYSVYQSLPAPRMSLLPTGFIRVLMHHFGLVEFRSERAMLRYLSLIDDLTAAEIPIIQSEWNTAIAFAGTWVNRKSRHTSSLHVETATQIWHRMEQEAGVESDHVTFNILFDVAAKAGKFALAEVIMKEMDARGLPENRYFRTNKIYYYGLKRDGGGVRKAYKELVDGGEFIDTLVLNAVIVSLMRAGEASAAEHVFERMKRLHAEKYGGKMVQPHWKEQRELGRILDRAARCLGDDMIKRAEIQERSPISPNLNTYRLLIKYHARESGNIDRISELLDEMIDYGLPIHGSAFFYLIHGFVLHGGVRYSSWTKARLDQVWALFSHFVRLTEEAQVERTELLADEERGCYLDSPIIICLLQAYNKVAGKEAALRVWQEVLEKWNPKTDDKDAVDEALQILYG